MIALLTSCGRFDLLEKTIESLFINQHYILDYHKEIRLYINEDSLNSDDKISDFIEKGPMQVWHGNYKFIRTNGIGQHASIEEFIKNRSEKYCLFLEDDWLFDNSYDWVGESIKIMERDHSIIKVLARADSPHPCIHDKEGYGILQPWENNGITWNGYSWNPGVTRLDLLKQFLPFPKWEQDLATEIHNAGYKVAELEKGIYKHIGDGRSTHE